MAVQWRCVICCEPRALLSMRKLPFTSVLAVMAIAAAPLVGQDQEKTQADAEADLSEYGIYARSAPTPLKTDDLLPLNLGWTHHESHTCASTAP